MDFVAAHGRERVRDDVPPPTRKTKKRVKRESILERFDRLATAYLEMHRRGKMPTSAFQDSTSRDHEISAQGNDERRSSKPVSKTITTSVSNFDIAEELNMEFDDELVAAVGKLIKAEEMARFADMINAAEAAVASVPPEFAEEAALAVARDYHTQDLRVIKEEIPGDTVIEVLGYVGTRGRRKDDGKPTHICVE